MHDMLDVNVVCFLASYFLALVLESQRLLRSRTVLRWPVVLLVIAGFVAHTLYLLNRSEAADLPPLLVSVHDWMLVLAWLVIVFQLSLTFSDRDLAMGLFLMPLVLFLVGVALFVRRESTEYVVDGGESVQAAIQRWGMLHGTLLVMGMVGVIMGLALGTMYLVQHRRLKRQRSLLDGLKLPSLERLARWNWWSVVLSMPLLTLGLLTGLGLGLLLAARADRPFSFADPTVVMSLAAWLFMAGLFGWLMRTDRPPGKQVASLTLWAFGLLLVTVLALQVLTSGGVLSLKSFHTRIDFDEPRFVVTALRCPHELPGSLL